MGSQTSNIEGWGVVPHRILGRKSGQISILGIFVALGQSWVLGASWRRLGAVLEPSCERLLGHLGASWGRLSVLGLFWRHVGRVGVLGASKGVLYLICRYNLNVLFRHAILNELFQPMFA